MSITKEYYTYLPSIYREPDGLGEAAYGKGNPNYLARYLRVFESVLGEMLKTDSITADDGPDVGIEEIIENLDRYIDPYRAPGEATANDFVQWLSSWVALTESGSWPEPSRRRLIANVVPLYTKRGTAEGMVRMLQLFVGVESIHVSHNEETFNELITSIKTIDEEPQLPEFAFDNYTFAVVVDLINASLSRYRSAVRLLPYISAVVDRERPAFTRYRVVSVHRTMTWEETFDDSSLLSLKDYGFDNVTHWEVSEPVDGVRVMKSTTPGGWEQVSRCTSPFFFVDRRLSSGVTVTWKVKFPTEHGSGWRENNKVWVALLDDTGQSLYELMYKPNRPQDTNTSPDVVLRRLASESGTLEPLGERETGRAAPHGSSAAWMSFTLELRPDAGDEAIRLTIDFGSGSPKVFTFEESESRMHLLFQNLSFQYKTGSGDNERFFVYLDDLAVMCDERTIWRELGRG